MSNLIDKSAVLAEIKERIETYNKGYANGDDRRADALEVLLHDIDTLEVKEMNLDFQRFAKEMDAIFALPSSETENTEEEPLNWEYAIAKHFYSLGLAQKGGEV